MKKFKVLQKRTINGEQPKTKNILWIAKEVFLTLGRNLSWQEAKDLRKKNRNSFITHDIVRSESKAPEAE